MIAGILENKIIKPPSQHSVFEDGHPSPSHLWAPDPRLRDVSTLLVPSQNVGADGVHSHQSEVACTQVSK